MRTGSDRSSVSSSPSRTADTASRALLTAAVERFTQHGLAFAEAYPPKQPRTDAEAFRGPLSMYLDAGFEPYRDAGESVIVRRPLNP